MVKTLQDVVYVDSKEALFTLSSTTSSNQYGIILNSQLQSHWYLQYYLFKFNYETRRPWSVRRFIVLEKKNDNHFISFHGINLGISRRMVFYPHSDCTSRLGFC